MKPIDPSLKAEIDSLATALDALLTKRPKMDPRDFPAELQERRMALLERHLGYRPAQPLPLVNCIGDSNGMFFSGAEHLRFIRYANIGFWRPRYINRSLDMLPCFRVYHTGPSTAWKAAEFGSSTRNREKIEWLLNKKVAPGSRVMLSFGEIDCRIHLPKQVMSGKPLGETVEKAADHFLPLARRVKALGFDCTIWGVSQITPRHENDPRASLPAVGALELRHEITYAFIAAMEERCQAEGIRHVALAGTYNPPNEIMPEEVFHDGVHLSQVMMPHALKTLQAAGVMDLK
jgi:hypothetical protein